MDCDYISQLIPLVSFFPKENLMENPRAFPYISQMVPSVNSSTLVTSPHMVGTLSETYNKGSKRKRSTLRPHVRSLNYSTSRAIPSSSWSLIYIKWWLLNSYQVEIIQYGIWWHVMPPIRFNSPGYMNKWLGPSESSKWFDSVIPHVVVDWPNKIF
jgi:hypothetical protein